MSSIRFEARKLIVAFLLLAPAPATSQLAPLRPQAPSFRNPTSRTEDSAEQTRHAQEELSMGTALTRRGEFSAAIPHLLAAREHLPGDYAANFNLSLCYVGTREFPKAITTLENLRRNHANADVYNLLAQAYVGEGRSEEALRALEQAVLQTPTNEKLYSFVGDACMDRRDYTLGLKVVELGLKALPASAKLHYQRALFLSLVDEFDQAREDFKLARLASPESEISYLAAANEAMYAGNPQEAVQVARQGIAKGYEPPTLLAILGEALIRVGVHPGETAFTEAQAALEKAAAKSHRDSGIQISLGKMCLMSGHTSGAIAHLNQARALDPDNAAIYSPLARAYQKAGDTKQAEQMLAILARLNQGQAEKISSAPGDRKAAYADHEPGHSKSEH